MGRTYFVERSIHLIEEHWLLIITGIQASGVIIDRLLRQCCVVWSECFFFTDVRTRGKHEAKIVDQSQRAVLSKS